MIRPKVTIKGNFEATEKLREAIKKAHDSYVSLGIHADAGKYVAVQHRKKNGQFGRKPTDMPEVGRVAFWLEYGTEHMPARPFLGPAIDENHEIVKKKMALGLAGIAFHHWTVEKGLSVIGDTALILVQNKMKSNVGPALSGSWDPPTGYLGYKREQGMAQATLVATGLLYRSLTYKMKLSEGAEIEAAKAAGELPAHGAPPSISDFADARAKARDDAQKAKAQARAQRQAFAGRDIHGRFLTKGESKAQKGKSHKAARAPRGKYRRR